jgi:cobaltochelatase CobS
MKLITVKFPAKCRKCAAAIAAGTYAYFGDAEKGQKIECTACRLGSGDQNNNEAATKESKMIDDIALCRNKLADLTVAQLVKVFKTAKGGTFGFNYAKDSRTNTKPGLIDYMIAAVADGTYTAEALLRAIDGADAVKPAAAAGSADAGSQLAQLIAQLAGGAVNEDRVREIVAAELDPAIDEIKAMAANKPRLIEVKVPNRDEVVAVGVAHKDFEQLLRACSARDADGHRLNIWLTGPAGSGKTTAAKKVAQALGLPFYFTGAVDTEYKLLGFVDANGRLNSRPFRQAYEHGGVFLFDEVDASLPGATLAFNAALANGVADFPDGMVERHPDFVCIAAANTWGTGGTVEYVGRNRLDAAFVDRFVQIMWGYDEELEEALAPNKEWCGKVRKWRAAAAKMGLKVIVSPRSTYFGASLLEAGIPEEQVIEMTVRKGMTADQWTSVRAAA